MRRIGFVLWMTAALLLPCMSCAEPEQAPADSRDEASAAVEARAQAARLLAELDRRRDWKLIEAPAAKVPDDLSFQPLANMEFRESGFIDRVSRYRRLSLLTLAEARDAQLFIGVDDNGLLGLHFNLQNRRDDRLELARL